MNILDRIAYDTGGYTVQEILSSFCKKILELVDLVNKNEEVVDDAHTLIENIRNEVVPPLVDDIMKDLQDNGYFDRLVNVTLINQLRSELTTLLNNTITELTTRLDNDIETSTPISTLSLQGITEEKNGENISSALTNILSKNNEKKYFYFDKNLKVDISNTLINYENSFLFGNAKINRFNPNNLFVNIADTFIKQYNGKINSCKNINQLKTKLDGYINEKRVFNVCVWGDS